jgi:hypothetical protein
MLEDFSGNLYHLIASLSGAENHFREAAAQRAVRVHIRKSKVGHRRRLKRA